MSTCVCSLNECVLCEGQVYSGLHHDHVCEIRGLLHRRTYKARQTLFFQEDTSEFVTVIKSGYVKLTTSLPDGREQILRIAGPGHLLGLEALESRRHPYTAESLTGTEVCQLRQRDLVTIMQKDSEVSLRVIQRLNAELERSQALVRDLGLKNSSERITSFIASLLPLEGSPSADLVLPLSRREIAEVIGLTVETVSRLMAKLRREAVIDETPGHIRVLDPGKLRAMTGADTTPGQ